MLKEENHKPGIYYDTFIQQYIVILSCYFGNNNSIFTSNVCYTIFMFKFGIEHRSHFLHHISDIEDL